MSSGDKTSSRAAWLAWGGVLTTVLALVSYFLVVPRISTALRDSGNANIALAGLGLLICLGGVVAARRSRAHRKTAMLCCLTSAGLSGLLAFYIHGLSYWLPPPERVLAVGARAPDFKLTDQNGVERTLADFSAKRLILVFFRGHW